MDVRDSQTRASSPRASGSVPVALPVPDPQVAGPITPPTKVDPPAGQINPIADINIGLSNFLEAPKPPTATCFWPWSRPGKAVGVE